MPETEGWKRKYKRQSLQTGKEPDTSALLLAPASGNYLCQSLPLEEDSDGGDLLRLLLAECPEELLGLPAAEYPEETEDPQATESYGQVGVGSRTGKPDINLVLLLKPQSACFGRICTDPVSGFPTAVRAQGWDLVE